MRINKDFINTLSMVSNLGVSLSVLVLVGYFVGNKLDLFFQTNGLLLAVSVILGILMGFLGFFITILKKIK